MITMKDNTYIKKLEKQLTDQRRWRHEEYLNYRLSTNKIAENKKEVPYSALNI